MLVFTWISLFSLKFSLFAHYLCFSIISTSTFFLYVELVSLESVFNSTSISHRCFTSPILGINNLNSVDLPLSNKQSNKLLCWILVVEYVLICSLLFFYQQRRSMKGPKKTWTTSHSTAMTIPLMRFALQIYLYWSWWIVIKASLGRF